MREAAGTSGLAKAVCKVISLLSSVHTEVLFSRQAFSFVLMIDANLGMEF